MYFDCSLTGFKVTGFPGYSLPIGTRLPDNQSVDSRDMMSNIAMPFTKARPHRVSENSTTSSIETNSLFEFISAGKALRIGNPDYNGVQVTIINSGTDKNTVVWGEDYQSVEIEAGESFRLEAIGGKWKELRTGGNSAGDGGGNGGGDDGGGGSVVIVATYSALPNPGVDGRYYQVLQDNLVYQYNAAKSRYETHYANFAALPVSGIESRFYITDDTGKVYTWHTNKYAEHYQSAGSFPMTGLQNRKYYAEDSSLIYDWGEDYGQYVLHCQNRSSFPAAGIENIVYYADDTGQTYFWNERQNQYSPREGGGGTQGAGNNYVISEQNLLTVLGVSTVPEAVEELHNRINNSGTSTEYLGGLNIGMYLDLPAFNDGTTNISKNESYQNLRIRIAGFDHYKNADNPLNHIVFEFKHVPIQKQMRTANTNDGGYPKSSGDVVLKPYLESGFLQGIIQALGLTSIDQQAWIMNTNRNVTAGQNGSWTKTSFQTKVFPLCEKEVFGTNTYGNSATESDLSQLEIYSAGVNKVKNYNGSAAWWWEGSPNASGTTSFCGVYATGAAASAGASDTGGGVSPCFCLC